MSTDTCIYPIYGDLTGEFLDFGLTGCVYALDDGTVIKVPHKEPSASELLCLEIEKRIFQRLKEHPRIVRCLEIREQGIVMERLKTSLRKFLSESPPNTISISQRLRWGVEAAEGLAYLHHEGMLQADVSCTNILLDSDDHLKYVDFSGSSIDGEESVIFYCTRNISPSSDGGNVTHELEIFAFGSVLYEIETGHPPYKNLTDSEVKKRYRTRNFPEVEGILLMGGIIQMCWKAVYAGMDEVLRDLLSLLGSHDGEKLGNLKPSSS